MAAHHVTVSKEGKWPDKPFLAQCSCPTSGRFADISDAVQFAKLHVIKTGGTLDVQEEPEPEKASSAS